MIPKRLSRVLPAGALTLAMLTGLAVPAIAKQVGVSPTATAVPGGVTPGANVAFDVEFFNPGPSNVSQLFLDAITPEGWILLGVESQSQGVCDSSSGDLHCSFGAVNALAGVQLRVVYTTPSDGGGDVDVDWFVFFTTGVSGDPGKNSHGDDYPTTGTVTLETSRDRGGAYTSTEGQIVTDDQELHARRNPQFTQVTAPEDLIGITVGEEPFDPALCPPAAGTCFGQWSVISVNDGAPYPDGFSVVLGYKGNIGNASFVHLFDDYDPDTNPTAYELIEYPEDLCSSATPTASEIPCMLLSSSGGDSFATLWLNENGHLSGY